MIPLRLRWATSIHKSQGMTLDKAVIYLSPTKFFSAQLASVALSRVRTIEGIVLKSCYEREWLLHRVNATANHAVNRAYREHFLVKDVIARTLERNERDRRSAEEEEENAAEERGGRVKRRATGEKEV